MNHWLDWLEFETETDNRLYIEHPNDQDNSITVAMGSKGNIVISVSDEQAVDSYNSKFECSISLPHDEAKKIAEFILKALVAHLDRAQDSES